MLGKLLEQHAEAIKARDHERRLTIMEDKMKERGA
jgi:hypothetical protein